MKHTSMPQGWNSWDVYHLTAAVYLPDRLRLRWSLLDQRTGLVQQVFGWRDVVQPGPHAADGSYWALELRWAGTILLFEWASAGKQLAATVQASQPTELLLVAEIDCAWNGEYAFAGESTQWQATIEDRDWLIQFERPAEHIPAYPQWVAFALDQPFGALIVPDGQSVASDAASLIAQQRVAYQGRCLASSGWLGDSAAGLVRSIHWNTIWEPQKARICTPVSRDWCRDPFWGGYVLFTWDTLLLTQSAMLEDPALARANLLALTQETPAGGFFPNYGSAFGSSEDRSNPPLGGYCALKLMRWQTTPGQTPHADFTILYHALLRWHDWWMAHRDGNGDGLLEWGSDPVPVGQRDGENHRLRGAMYESGLDNSPMYDEVTYNTNSHTMELADVGLNALYALDCWAISIMAAELGYAVDAARLSHEYATMAERINAQLWNEAAGTYQNRHWDGRFSSHLSPTVFYPLLAGIVPPERATRMVEEHLLNSDAFWGEWILPSIARNDPGYRSAEHVRSGLAHQMNDYWRGRIWPPMNYLVGEGLRQAGFAEQAREFAYRSVGLFRAEWEDEGHVHENYDDLTGDGDNVNNSNSMYHWGGLLALLGIHQLVDCDLAGRWTFGTLDPEPAAIQHVCTGLGMLDVVVGETGLQICANGNIMFATSAPAQICEYAIGATECAFRLLVARPLTLTIGQLPPQRLCDLAIDGITRHTETDLQGQINFDVANTATVTLKWS